MAWEVDIQMPKKGNLSLILVYYTGNCIIRDQDLDHWQGGKRPESGNNV
jgi:hypothetical protein